MRPRYFLALVMAALPLTGCDLPTGTLSGGNGNTVVVGDTTSGRLAITRTNVDPSLLEVDPGQTLELSVETRNPSGQSLRYNWRTSSGQLSGTSGNPVTWTAPRTAGVANVQVEVLSGSEEAQAAFRFTVRGS